MVVMFMQLWKDWELQLLVLLSFMLQVFVLFSGGLRRCSTNSALRLLIWLAYLLSDLVAVYTLGQLSQHESDADGVGEKHKLKFFWTPFLLIHLGGQDTITAFSIEDNELWLRHLLNLLTQVGLAIYSLRPKKSVVLEFQTSYLTIRLIQIFLYEYHLFCYDLFYH
jgi:hypothetical protein